jgi:magnesium transporter
VASRDAASHLVEARDAATATVRSRLAHRLPWLAVGLVGAMLAAGLVSAFEETLRENVLLAFFVPAVVYMADAIGTQTETVVIRGIALGVPIRSIARRELVSGVIVGVLLATSFFAFVVAVWGDERVALVVAISLLLSASLATGIAMTLPYVLDRLGLDPAFGSGPIATVVQDLLSIAVYFAAAVALL